MSELTLLVLRLGFLAVMWAFVFAIVYALRSDLFGSKNRRAEAIVSPPVPQPRAASMGGLPSAGAAAAAPAAAPVAGVAAGATTDLSAGFAGAAGPAPRRLVITDGPRSGVEVDLTNNELTIGRSAACGLVIRDDYTSTSHARLQLRAGGWVIEDLGSTNGTTVNGLPVTVPTPLDVNVPVRIGTTTFELRR